MTGQTKAMEELKLSGDSRLNAVYDQLSDDQRVMQARHTQELKEASRENLRASAAYTQGTRSDLVSHFFDVATQIDNIASNADLRKAKQQAHAASVLLAAAVEKAAVEEGPGGARALAKRSHTGQ